MHVGVKAWPVKHAVEDVEAKIFKHHAEDDLKDELIASWEAVSGAVHRFIRIDQ